MLRWQSGAAITKQIIKEEIGGKCWAIYVLRFAYYRDNIFTNVYVVTAQEWKFKGDAMMGDRKARRLHKQRNKGGKMQEEEARRGS